MEFDIENTKYLGLALGILGLTALIFLLPVEKSIQISKISEQNIGENAVIVGAVNELRIVEGNAFFVLENNNKINAVFFNIPTKQASLLRNNQLIEARGTISFYNGELQIIINRVKKID